MRIRKAKESDLDRLCELGLNLLRCHSQFRKYYVPVRDAAKRKRLQRNYYKAEMNRRNALFLVIADGDKLGGYSIAKIEKDPPVLLEPLKGNFAEIFIDADYRGKGFGSQLLRRSLEWFRKRKVKRAIVKYDAKNDAAGNFYSDAGFRPFQNEYEVYLK